MSEQLNDGLQGRRETISALVDGDATSADEACALWAADAGARDAWHAYHLIGDALRSDDLAVPRAHDDAFLSALRLRLASEPTVLAPFPVTVAKKEMSLHRWRTPAVVAAGFVVVAGVLVAVRTVAPGGTPAAVTVAAATPASAPTKPVVVGRNTPSVPESIPGGDSPSVIDGQVIRDARLDSYLRAHRGASPVLPGGAAGRFESVVLER